MLGGDSFTERLDANKLGKGKKKVLNISKGGSKISDVQKSLETFHNEHKDTYSIGKLFLSIGANDIRHCTSGVKHLKGPVNSLIKCAKQLFPVAKIFVQSVLPLPVTRLSVARNVNGMNWLLYNTCSKFHVLFLNVFYDFVTSQGFRNLMYFNGPIRPGGYPDCHPNARGMGILAHHYIYLIHTKRFNPLGY